MTRLSRFAAVVVLVGGATAVLSSCSGDPGPVVTETPSPTAVVSAPPSPSPTPSVTPEEELLAQIPEDARGEDFASATQFSRFFLELYPAMFATDGDTQLFAWLSGEDCGFCKNAVDNVAETRAADAFSVGGATDFPGLVASGGLRDDGYWYVSDKFVTEPATTYGPDGAVLDQADAFTGEVRFRLEYVVDHWQVDAIDFDFDDA